MPPLFDLGAASLPWEAPDRPPRLQNAIDRLFDRINYERISPGKYQLADFELSRMRSLLAELDDPHLATPCVHIAGTKGKGSTASMTAAILVAAGYRTGLFTSPHIHHFEERIVVDGAWIPVEVLQTSFEEVWAAADRLDARGEHATYFEITTALAWDVFRRMECQLAVVEVGLGGRLDSTNLCDSLVTAITSISRDHSKLLGETLGEIAREKAGIFKPDVPAVSGVTRNVADVVRECAAAAGCSLWQLGREIAFNERPADSLSIHPLSVTTPVRTHQDLQVVLPGSHQSRNAAVAVAICDLMPRRFAVSEQAIQSALASAKCPLRVEVVSHRPTIVLDAAHNGASIAALVETVHSVPASKRWLIFGTSLDKHVDDMFEQMAKDPTFADEIIVTAYSTNPRAMRVEEVAELASAVFGDRVRTAPDAAAAIDTVLAEANDDDLILVTGSFFLAGEVREHLGRAAQQMTTVTSAESSDLPL